MVNLPPITYKPGKPHEHIEEDEYHSLQEWDRSNMPEILDDTPANMLVKFSDDRVENLSKSPTNVLLYEHNLWGLLRTGNEILSMDRDDYPPVQIIPDENAERYTLRVGGEELNMSPDMKPRLVDTLHEVYKSDGEETPQPIIDLFDEVRANMVRREVTDYFENIPPFLWLRKDGPRTEPNVPQILEITDNGWLFHDELLLTWEAEFRHPDTTQYELRGSVVATDGSNDAYKLRGIDHGEKERTMTIEGEEYRLTENELNFLSMAMFAVKVKR